MQSWFPLARQILFPNAAKRRNNKNKNKNTPSPNICLRILPCQIGESTFDLYHGSEYVTGRCKDVNNVSPERFGHTVYAKAYFPLLYLIICYRASFAISSCCRFLRQGLRAAAPPTERARFTDVIDQLKGGPVCAVVGRLTHDRCSRSQSTIGGQKRAIIQGRAVGTPNDTVGSL